MSARPAMRLASLLLSVSMGLVATGCGDGTGQPRPAAFVRLSGIPGGTTVEFRPEHPTGRTVLFVHGSGETAVGLASDQLFAPTLHALLDAGYTVAATDAYGKAWGDPEAMAAYVDLARRLDPTDAGIDVVARSMGGMVAFRLPDHHRVLAIAALFPACDLASMDHPPYDEAIAAAYGDQLGQALATESPALAGDLSGVRIHVWASPDDTVVPATTNGYACAADAQREGAEVSLTHTTGEHGDASNYDPAAVLSLFAG